MNLLLVKINDRIDKALNFDKDSLHNNHFIVQSSTTGDWINLLELGENNYVSKDGKSLFISEATVKTENNKIIEEADRPANSPEKGGATGYNKVVVEVKLTKEESKKKDIYTSDDNKILVVYDKKSNSQTLFASKQCKGLVELNLIIDGNTTYTQSLCFHFEENIYNAIMDFGSEASQACWKKDGEDDSHPVKILRLIKDEHYTAKKTIEGENNTNNEQQTGLQNNQQGITNDTSTGQDQEKDSDFVQYEKDAIENAEFYRSIYYIKKNIAGNVLKDWPNYSDETIKYIVKTTEEINKREYIQIPNAKLLNFRTNRYTNRVTIGGNEADIKSFNNGIVPKLMMNNIVSQTLKSIEYNMKTNNDDGTCGVVLYVLMPNVYPIHIVSKKLNDLATDIQNNLTNKFPHIKGVELRYISESDASLLGRINKINSGDNAIDPGTYLIIDAGKGTLDYSLMKIDRNGHPPCANIYRGGIVGAGAAISYGVLVALVNEFLSFSCKNYSSARNSDKEKQIRQFILKIIKCEDVAILHETMNLVDEYKMFFNGNFNENYGIIKEDPTSQVDFENLGLSSMDNLELKYTHFFNDFVKKWKDYGLILSESSAKYVTAEIQQIVNEALDSIKLVSFINQKDKGKNADNRPVVDSVMFTGRGCLMKEFIKSLEYSLEKNGIIPEKCNKIIPNKSMKTGCMDIFQSLVTGRYNTAELRQSWFTYSTINDAKETSADTSGRRKGAKDNKIDDLAGKAENKILEFGKLARRFFWGKEEKLSNISDFGEGNAAFGINIGLIKSSAEKINIGGWGYQINTSFHEIKKEFILYFDGESYVIVSKDRKHEQSLGAGTIDTTPEAKLGFESMFPNININNDNDVVIPQLIDQSDIVDDQESASEDTLSPDDTETNEDAKDRDRASMTPTEKINDFVKKLLNFFMKKPNNKNQTNNTDNQNL